MEKSKPQRIAYLFGAGATHAELTNLDPTVEEKEERLGLLMRDVSARVIQKTKKIERFWNDMQALRKMSLVAAPEGSPNIELFISLIENSKIHGWEDKTRELKKLVRTDIQRILTPERTRRFYLHKGLLELHQHKLVRPKEQLAGLISLNYDNVLDQALNDSPINPDYCLESARTPSRESIPLLKLHGSFDWTDVIVRGRKRSIEIIPLGSNKNYLHPPYNFIWNRALEVLIECDTLRVIGCSINQNDLHLADLLFKAHLERTTTIRVEIIDTRLAGERIKREYGFFPSIITIADPEGALGPEPNPKNPFKTWLKYRILDRLRGRLEKTKHLKTIVEQD